MKGSVGDRHFRQSLGHAIVRDEIDAAAVEADEGAAGCRRRRAAGEAGKALRGLLDIGNRDDDVDEPDSAVRMLQPSLLPHRLLGVMRQHLNSPFRHRFGLDARNGEGRRRRAGHGLDRSLHVHQIANRETIRRQPPMRLFCIGDGKGCKMQPGVTV